MKMFLFVLIVFSFFFLSALGEDGYGDYPSKCGDQYSYLDEIAVNYYYESGYTGSWDYYKVPDSEFVGGYGFGDCRVWLGDTDHFDYNDIDYHYSSASSTEFDNHCTDRWDNSDGCLRIRLTNNLSSPINIGAKIYNSLTPFVDNWDKSKYTYKGSGEMSLGVMFEDTWSNNFYSWDVKYVNAHSSDIRCTPFCMKYGESYETSVLIGPNTWFTDKYGFNDRFYPYNDFNLLARYVRIKQKIWIYYWGFGWVVAFDEWNHDDEIWIKFKKRGYDYPSKSSKKEQTDIATVSVDKRHKEKTIDSADDGLIDEMIIVLNEKILDELLLNILKKTYTEKGEELSQILFVRDENTDLKAIHVIRTTESTNNKGKSIVEDALIYRINGISLYDIGSAREVLEFIIYERITELTMLYKNQRMITYREK